ncbi:uncharacterized protein [Gossypium hirsutum]|uniref:Integrase zinc-binding domain-containing protein n=1 Tax=Gossypium hirsutum TaxID=3635 RepID=A0ABM2ZBL8_GOSHI|nr:uncharacterized protein LOC121211403 [Gossypium hirsutum]
MTDLRAMFSRLSLYDDGSLLVELQVKPTWLDQIKDNQLGDKSLELRFRQVEAGTTTDFRIDSDGVLRFPDRICVHNDEDLRLSILREAHSSTSAMRPRGNKMYRDFRELYWWPGLKHEVTDFVAHYDGQSDRAIQILEDMLRGCVMEFRGRWEEYMPLAEFTCNNSYQSSIQMTPYEVLYGSKCCTPLYWTELGERRILGQELVSEIEDKLELPSELDCIHDVFHVSILRHYRSNPSHIVPVEKIDVRPDLTFEEEPVQILDRDVKILRRKSISLVKGLIKVQQISNRILNSEKTPFFVEGFGVVVVGLAVKTNQVCTSIA